MWEFSPRRSARSATRIAQARSSVPVATRLSAFATPSRPSGGEVLEKFKPEPSAVDEALRRLEADVRRAAQISDAAEREKILIAACLNWAERDPRDALRLARELGLDEVSNALLEDILQKWADTDFPAALAWANHAAAGEQRDHLMTRLAFVRSQTQPDAAAKLVVEQIPPGPAQAEAGISVLHQWALRDFKGAWAWVDRFPRDLQDRARAELAAVARYHLASNGVSR